MTVEVSRCSKCGAISRVTETRASTNGSTRRRRKCSRPKCGHAWSTVEIMKGDGPAPVVIDHGRAVKLRDRLRSIAADLDLVLGVEVDVGAWEGEAAG